MNYVISYAGNVIKLRLNICQFNCKKSLNFNKKKAPTNFHRKIWVKFSSFHTASCEIGVTKTREEILNSQEGVVLNWIVECENIFAAANYPNKMSGKLPIQLLEKVDKK